MTPKTAREKMLMLVLPAALILGVYSFKLPGLREKATGAAAALAAAQGALPPPAQVQAELKKISELTQQLAETEAQNKEWESRWQEQRNARSTDSTARIEAIEGLTALLNRHQIELRDGAPADTTTGGGKLPKGLERVATLLADNKPELKPQLWRVRFVGRYQDVVQALAELKEAEPLAIPIHLQMGEANLTTAARNWTLYLWI